MPTGKMHRTENTVADIVTLCFAVLFIIALFCVVLYTWDADFWESKREFGLLYEAVEYLDYAKENTESALIVLVTEVVFAVLMFLFTLPRHGELKMAGSLVRAVAIIAFVACLILYFVNIFHYSPLGMLLYYYGFGLSIVFTVPAFRL